MRTLPFLFLVLISLLIALPGTFAQAGRYPEAARLMARDGFAQRQKGYLAAINKESQEANRLGFLAYQKKDYETAVRYFEGAIVLDKTNMFAHFNLACTLSLAFGGGGGGDPEALKDIRLHLSAAADLDEHWIYKAFLDADLEPVRGRLVEFTIYFPCPGDNCPDQSYDLHPNGTAEYYASLPDLSLMGDISSPHPPANGWYLVIGDCFLIYIPGQIEILKSFGATAPMPEEGEELKDTFNRIPFTRDASGKITVVEPFY